MKRPHGLQPTVGHLDPASQPAQWWSTIVGSLEVPLRGILPEMRQHEQTGELMKVYYVDISKLTPAQIEGICKVMAATFDVPIDEVRTGIRDDHGLPIRAEYISTISFDGRHFL